MIMQTFIRLLESSNQVLVILIGASLIIIFLEKKSRKEQIKVAKKVFVYSVLLTILVTVAILMGEAVQYE